MIAFLYVDSHDIDTSSYAYLKYKHQKNASYVFFSIKVDLFYALPIKLTVF